jgi:Spy/CpxP family protein refolding chaperone
MNTKTSRIRMRCAAAAFLAAALFPSFAAAQETRRPAQPGDTRVERARPLADLGLTSDQRKALEEFRKARRDEMRTFRDEMAKLRDEMRGLAKDPQANQAKIDALIDRRAALRAGREKAGLRARAERNKIFTPEQLEKLKSLRSQVAGRAGLAGRGRMMGPGRFTGLRAGARRMARLRALRHRPLLRRWRW